jgi:protein gp37
MNKTRIEWADYTWNPIKGVCPVGCWYCYARRIYQRFKLDPKPWLDYYELNEAVLYRGRERLGKKIFVCSTFELFHPIADPWRGYIFDVIQRRQDMTFIILTKLPERIDRPMPPNVWLGVSVTGPEDWRRAKNLIIYREASVKFISFEPLLADVTDKHFDFPYVAGELDWFIVGRLTGHGKKYDPSPRMIQGVVDVARELGRPIFLKNNLASIWPGPLIQEFPK